MILICGLGNPDKEYQETRHNIGFRMIEKISLEFGFPNFLFSPHLQGEISKMNIFQKEVLLFKPSTYMNNSGVAVKKAIEYLNIPFHNLWIIHDDIDLTFGKIRIVKNRGSGGHKGVESIIKEIKTKNFVRLRIGIQPLSGKPKDVKDFVLKGFSKKELNLLPQIEKKIIKILESLLKEGFEKTISKYNE